MFKGSEVRWQAGFAKHWAVSQGCFLQPCQATEAVWEARQHAAIVQEQCLQIAQAAEITRQVPYVITAFHV